MAKGHKDKVAIITGAANGIGQAFAKRLAEDGVHIAIVDLVDGKDTVKLVEAAGRQALAVKCDVSSETSVAAMAKEVQSKFSHVDIVINCAGVFPQMNFPEMTFADWRKVLSTNLDGTFLVTAAFVPGMRSRKWGRVVNISGSMEPRGLNAAIAAKGALHLWAKGLSCDIARDGVTLNTLQPGRIDSEQIREKLHPTEQSRRTFIERNIPIGYFGEPADVAHLVGFLASPAARYITGSVIPVDGGMHYFAH